MKPKPLQVVEFEEDIEMSSQQFDSFEEDMRNKVYKKLKKEFQDLELDFEISWVTKVTVKVYQQE